MTRLIPLDHALFALVDDADYEHLSKWKWRAQKHRDTFYAVRLQWNPSTRKSKHLFMHRVIMGAVGKQQVDHIDLNGLNNTRANLRIATNSQNHANMRRTRASTSGYKGIHWRSHANAWCAQIMVNYQHIHLGYFKNKQDAARAYNQAALKYFGEFARLNPA